MLTYRKRKFVARKTPYAKKPFRSSARKSRDYSTFSLRSFPPYFADQPPFLKAKLRYSCQVQAVHAEGSPNHFEFRANGMYDPEVAVGGHQPYGFDQLTARYQHWTVVYATCKAQFLQTTENFNSVWKLFAYKEQGTPANMWNNSGGANGLNEMSIQSTTIIGAANQMKESHRDTNTLFMNVPRIMGVTSATDLVNGSEYAGTENADPSHQCYFGLSGYNPEGSLEDSGHKIQIDIVYYAVFTKPVFFITS